MKKLPPDITFRHLRFDPDHMEMWEMLLSPEEERRVQGFSRTKRRQEFILGRAAARMLLSERLDREPGEVLLEVSASGAIDVLDSDLHVSIAHSNDHAVAAAAPRYIGVDIEAIESRHERLHRYMLHPDEYDLVHTLPIDSERAHILCWALKEASLKAMRTGLRYSPKKLRLDIDVDREEAIIIVNDGRTWHAFFEEWDGYYVAVAIEPS